MATYYIDGDAAGGGDGSLSTPWNDIEDAESYDSVTGFNAGDIIKFKRGTVITSADARFIATNSGSSGNPITWTTYYNADGSDDASQTKPVIDCGNTNAATTTWTEQTGNGLPGVYLSDYTGTTIYGLWEDQVWLTHASDIEAIGAGEWFWNNASNPSHSQNLSYADGIYYKPSSGVPTDHTVKRGTSKEGMIFVDIDHITLSNLHFKGGWRNVAVRCGASAASNVEGWTIDNCEFSESTEPVYFEGRNNYSISGLTVTDNYFHDVGHGITCQANSAGDEELINATITGNQIINLNSDGKFSTFITNTTIDQEAIEVQNGNNVLIENNTITNIGKPSDKGTGIIVWVHPTTGEFTDVIVRNNQITNVVDDGIVLGAGVGATNTGSNICNSNIIDGCGDNGIKINTSCVTSFVCNNTIRNADLAIECQTTCSGWTVANNIVDDSTTNHVRWATSTNVSKNNVFYPDGSTLYNYNSTNVTLTSWKTSVSDTTSVASDPQLINNVPASTSPCVGTGVRWWTFANPVGFDGEPLADMETDIGAIQSKHSILHPTKL
jgi:hypothetical protein